MTKISRTQALLGRSPLVEAIDLTPKGHLRIATVFRYPDGSNIDLFLINRQDLLSNVEPLILTDFGGAFLWLDQLDIRPMKSQRRRRLTEDALQTYNIDHDKGALSCFVEPETALSGLLRLGQACLRISDLIFTQRAPAQSSFAEEVETIIDDAGVDYKHNAETVGRNGVAVSVEFLVHAPRATLAVLLLPAENLDAATARTRANEVFARCYDLRDWQGRLYAALDDRRPLYREEDLGRIRDLAYILPLSKAEMFRDILLAK